MATMFEPQYALALAELLSAETNADTGPGQPAHLPQDQDQVMQEPNQLVTNLALAQAWSFAGVVSDAEPPESVPSETALPWSHRDADTAGLAAPQNPVSQLAAPDTTGSEEDGTQVPAPESLFDGSWPRL
jgi:hypothetical protein